MDLGARRKGTEYPKQVSTRDPDNFWVWKMIQQATHRPYISESGLLFARRHQGYIADPVPTKLEMLGSKRWGCRWRLREIRQHLKIEMGGGHRGKEEQSMKNRTRNIAESRKAREAQVESSAKEDIGPHTEGLVQSQTGPALTHFGGSDTIWWCQKSSEKNWRLSTYKLGPSWVPPCLPLSRMTKNMKSRSNRGGATPSEGWLNLADDPNPPLKHLLQKHHQHNTRG